MGVLGVCPFEPLEQSDRLKGNRVKKKWKPYQPTKYDLQRDPSLVEKKEFEWESYRDFKKMERNRFPSDKEDVCYRGFRKGKE